MKKLDEVQRYELGKWVNRIGIALVIIFSIPTTMILATWNTLPGEQLYPVKRILENAALWFVGGNFEAKSSLESQLVKQRFSETQAVIDSPEAIYALQELSTGVQKATSTISNNKTTGSTPSVAQKEKAKKLAQELRTYEEQLSKVTVENQTEEQNETATELENTAETIEEAIEKLDEISGDNNPGTQQGNDLNERIQNIIDNHDESDIEQPNQVIPRKQDAVDDNEIDKDAINEAVKNLQNKQDTDNDNDFDNNTVNEAIYDLQEM